MALELRPSWCLTDDRLEDVVSFGPWLDDTDTAAVDRDGDDWAPGEELLLRRSVEFGVDVAEVRRLLDLRPGAVVGVGARWRCRATGLAGVHVGGPLPASVSELSTLELAVPATIAVSIEIETCLVVRWPFGASDGGTPHGGLLWSDGWVTSVGERTVLLEGSEMRIPVRTVSFKQYFDDAHEALWAIELDPSIEPEDLVANVATVLVNADALRREFKGPDGEPDASRLPKIALAGISADLVRSLTGALVDELEDAEDWKDAGEGTVGTMLATRLTETFGSITAARNDYLSEQATFTRRLWSRFAPDTWSG